MTENELDERPINVLLVDDHAVVREGIRSVLGRSSRIAVIGEASDAESAIQKTNELLPDVVVLDVRLREESGFDVCRAIQDIEAKEIRVLMLTAIADDRTVWDAVSAGADGYLLKDVDGEGLISSVLRIFAGQSILDPAVTGSVFKRMKNDVTKRDSHKLDILSKQEYRIFGLVSEGKTNKEIGEAMGLSDKTVKNYLRNAMDKLNLNRRSQVAAYYVSSSG